MTISDRIRYCNICGDSISILVPEGDNRERHVCNRCGEIQYQNPKIVTGCIPVLGDRVLLCKRAIEPRKGFWTVPAGFMENLETVAEGAARETMEEACAPVSNMRLFGVFSLPRISQVYVMFVGEMESETSFGVGEESLEVALYREDQIPWDDIAFRVVTDALKKYFSERMDATHSVALADLR